MKDTFLERVLLRRAEEQCREATLALRQTCAKCGQRLASNAADEYCRVCRYGRCRVCELLLSPQTAARGVCGPCWDKTLRLMQRASAR